MKHLAAILALAALCSCGSSTDSPSQSQAELSSVATSAGQLSVGDTWDDALPKLNTGTRLQFGFEGQDRAVEGRRFRSGTYRLTFERASGGPLRLARITEE
jgi:hypothetical protein